MIRRIAGLLFGPWTALPFQSTGGQPEKNWQEFQCDSLNTGIDNVGTTSRIDGAPVRVATLRPDACRFCYPGFRF